MSKSQINAFDTLLTSWLDHQHLRDAGASIAELNSSRIRLDTARLHATSPR